MAEVASYDAFATIGTVNKKLSTVSVKVSETDGKAFVAAADTAARSATKVGLLLNAISNLALGNPTSSYQRGVKAAYVNDAFAYPTDEAAYASNKIVVNYDTTVAGLPRSNSFSIPCRDPGEYSLESDGIGIVQDDAASIADLVTQVEDTLLSTYLTAVTVTKVQVNDD